MAEDWLHADQLKQGGERNNAMRNAFAFYNTYTDLFNRGEIIFPLTISSISEMTRGELSAFVDEFNATHNTNVTSRPRTLSIQ